MMVKNNIDKLQVFFVKEIVDRLNIFDKSFKPSQPITRIIFFKYNKTKKNDDNKIGFNWKQFGAKYCILLATTLIYNIFVMGFRFDYILQD